MCYIALHEFLQLHLCLFYIYNLAVQTSLPELRSNNNAIAQQILCCKRGLGSTPLLYLPVCSKIIH